MGAPMLRPRPGGPLMDAREVAEIVGRPVEVVYGLDPVLGLPRPVNPCEPNKRLWRWSRKRVTLWAERAGAVAA